MFCLNSQGSVESPGSPRSGGDDIGYFEDEAVAPITDEEKKFVSLFLSFTSMKSYLTLSLCNKSFTCVALPFDVNDLTAGELHMKPTSKGRLRETVKEQERERL